MIGLWKPRFAFVGFNWFALFGPLALFGSGALPLFAQEDLAARANAIWATGNRLEALPLYEQLAAAHPGEWVYQERLAVALGVKAEHITDPAEIKALLTRERDAAQKAVADGDPNYFMQLTAKIDPDTPILGPATPGSAEELFQAGEKAFGTGDYAGAIVKYAAAADADPHTYTYPLYAGDAAYSMKDIKTAAHWFARAISVDPTRETAYRYWGDALLRVGNDPAAAKGKYIEAVIAEPYNKLAWQGISNWAVRQKAVILAPKIIRPSGPVVDPKKPNNLTINIDPGMTDEKKHPGSYAWIGYSMARAAFRGDEFKKLYPNEKEYRHTLKEEDAALSSVAEIAKEAKAKGADLDESLRNLLDLSDAGMLDCWILINGADQGIAQDYPAYRQDHRQLLNDYLAKFVIHGGSI
jgi:tetratricopeptide (TPR) repeat protein